MEINHYGDTILPAFAKETLHEGRFAVLTTHAADYDFGSKVDLPGARYPLTAEESARARYVIAWEEDNRGLPITVTPPSYTFALREGWDQAANVPYTSEMWLDHPANQAIPPAIASGTGVKLYGEGIYTIPSGTYVYNVLMETPGCQLTVANLAVDGAADLGKLKYLDGTTGIVAEVYFFNTSTLDLTFKVLH